MARESRKRKKEYIQSLEDEIKELKSTVCELRNEIKVYKDCEKVAEFNVDPTTVKAKQYISEEILRTMEKMVKDKGKEEHDLKECISYLEANHGPMCKDRQSLIKNIFKTLIDKLLPDFIKCVFSRCEDQTECKEEELNKMMKCSKYQFNELVHQNKIGEWQKCLVMMNLTKEQQEKMNELKEFSIQSRQKFRR